MTTTVELPVPRPDPSLLDRLFGGSPPGLVVVANDAGFEIWQEGEFTEWVLHPYAGDPYLQIEGGWVATGSTVVSLTDPTDSTTWECPSLVVRNGNVLVRERCRSDEDRLTNLMTGDRVPFPDPIESDCETATWFERQSVVIRAASDAEGNLCAARSATAANLIGDDYPGFVGISADGRWFAYSDHRNEASPHYSPVVVVRSTHDGAEIGRWRLDGAVTCLQAASDWVVVCEADVLSFIETERHDALVAIDLATSEIRRVQTTERVYLPIP